MGKLGCPCGYVHNLSPIPGPGFDVVPERLREQLIYSDDVGERSAALREGFDLFECPECGRIMTSPRDGEAGYRVYVREFGPWED
jgi:hypothetical protein